MMADDLGWSGISAHPGGTIPTPKIDRLFKQGVEPRNFMGWCVCSPTRAMLLTGRHCFRVGTGPEAASFCFTNSRQCANPIASAFPISKLTGLRGGTGVHDFVHELP